LLPGGRDRERVGRAGGVQVAVAVGAAYGDVVAVCAEAEPFRGYRDSLVAGPLDDPVVRDAGAGVQLPDGSIEYYASASGGRLSSEQIDLLKEFGIPEQNILTAAKGHPEENIFNAMLPEGTQFTRWGIASGSQNSPEPCAEKCATFIGDNYERDIC
jgi:hypothetical protein